MARRKSAIKKSKPPQKAGRSQKAAKKPAARAAARPRTQKRPLLADIMTPDIDVLRPTDTAAEAARRMRNLDVGVVPVCEDSRLVGVITDRDITLRVVAEGKDPNTVQLRDCCTGDVIAAEPDWSVDKAADVMAKHQIRRLPVVDRGMLVGMVSLGDLAVKTQKPEPTAKALKEISQPTEPRIQRQKATA